VATEAGWRSTVRRSIAQLVPQREQNKSSHGLPAISAARIVGDHNMSRPAATWSFRRSQFVKPFRQNPTTLPEA
jgi:hypothetical protein